GNVSMDSAARFKRVALMAPMCRWTSNLPGIIVRASVCASAFGGTERCPNVCSEPSANKSVSKGDPMRTREMFFSPWQAADYTGLKVEAIYELLASGEIAGEQVDGRWRLRKSVLDAWLDAEVSPEELEKLTTKMSRLSEEQARQVLEQAQGQSCPGRTCNDVGGKTVTAHSTSQGRAGNAYDV